MSIKRLALLLACAALLVTLAACGGDEAAEEEPQDPIYSIGLDSVETFAMEDEDAELMELNTEGPAHYTYRGLSEPGVSVETYVTRMTEEKGFEVVDEDIYRTSMPDFTKEEGDIRIARPALQDGEVLEIALEWAPETCVVTVEVLAGEIQNKPLPEEPAAAAPAPVDTSMTLTEAVAFVRGLQPSVFGLSGGSMDQYEIYVLDGSVLVNEEPCMRLRIYSTENPENTNEIQGIYFLSNSGKSLYRFNQNDDTVTALSLPQES